MWCDARPHCVVHYDIMLGDYQLIVMNKEERKERGEETQSETWTAEFKIKERRRRGREWNRRKGRTMRREIWMERKWKERKKREAEGGEGREEMIDRSNSDIQLSPTCVFIHSTLQPLCHMSRYVLFFHLMIPSRINATHTHTHMHHLITPQHNTLGHEWTWFMKNGLALLLSTPFCLSLVLSIIEWRTFSI